MQPIYVSIQQEATGKRIKYLLMQKGYTVRQVQEVMGFENPQAVYKWLSGRSLPSIDNLLVLSRLLQTSIEDILVTDENVAAFPWSEKLYLNIDDRRANRDSQDETRFRFVNPYLLL